jgi:hypothetical protein
MRRLVYMVALALVAMFVLAPGAMAQQMNGQHMMPNGQMMDDSQMMGANNRMASPSASASATPSASDNGTMMGANRMMASPSASASASPSASAYSSGSATPTATASAPRGHLNGGRSSSTSAAVGGQLPSTGGVPLVTLVSVGALALLAGFGLAAARLLRRSS